MLLYYFKDEWTVYIHFFVCDFTRHAKHHIPASVPFSVTLTAPFWMISSNKKISFLSGKMKRGFEKMRGKLLFVKHRNDNL
jgi:hypothetical protein